MSYAKMNNGIDLTSSGVYCIENLVDGKVYVGSTRNFVKRWDSHVTALNRKRHGNRLLQKAWIEHGEDAFVFYPLEEIKELHLLQVKEQEYLDRFNAISYNLFSVAIRPAVGVENTPENRAAMSQALKNYFQTEEGKATRERLTKQCAERMNSERGVEIKKKIADRARITNKDPIVQEKNRKAQIERFSDPELKKEWMKANGCRCFCCEQTGKKYWSTAEAAEELGIGNSIWRILNGTYKQLDGFTFRYCNEDEEIEIKPYATKPPKSRHKNSRCFCCEQTGEKYWSTTEAGKLLGMTRSDISNVLAGRWKQFRRFTFRYCDEDEVIEVKPYVTKPLKASRHTI